MPGASIGYNAGYPVNENDRAFRQFEISAEIPLLKSPWRLGDAIIAYPSIVTTAGMIMRLGTEGWVATAGPSIVLGDAGNRFAVSIGSNPTVLGEDAFPGKNVGGLFHFTSHLSVRLRLVGRLAVAYRIQHLSNAGLNQPNPGVNFHMLGMRLAF